MIIGLGHYSRTGKDTFANALVDALREMDPSIKVAKVSFATKLKQIAADLYGWAGLKGEDYYNDPAHEHERDVVLPGLNMTPVDVWVKFGTQAVRKNVYDATWVDYVLKTDHDLDVMIIPDVRFINEVNAILDAGGHLIKIVRAGYGPRLTVADLSLIYYKYWDNVIGDIPSGEIDGIKNLKMWASKYAAKILSGGNLNTLKRQDIKEALSVESMPGRDEVLDVFIAAGLPFPGLAPFPIKDAVVDPTFQKLCDRIQASAKEQRKSQ